MSGKRGNFSRREFIKTAGGASIGSVLIPLSSLTHAHGSSSTKLPEQMIVPKRTFGKTGVNVSILSLGGVLGIYDQLIFRQAFKMGVTYWDTADSYGRGNNEKAIGKYFTKFPNDRKKVFLVTKASTSDPPRLTEKLNASLQRMNTSYIDMYFIHSVNDVKNKLTNEVKAWAEKAKAKGKIRFFGFSAHKNMENSMLAAAKLGWIDGIMMSYNYRLMVKNEMKRAVDACVKAGIGLTAMKTQAAFSANFYASIGSETDDALKMTENFLKKGYTAEQANLKVVWENPNIASICSAMRNITILQANVAAALNKKNLSEGDKKRLEQYARETAPCYCAGCANICESAVDLDVPISDILRYSMYNHSYGDRDRALMLLNALPADIKANILMADYSKAEKYCPQKIQIGKVLKKTYEDLT
ncbi:MAG: aldo/keto reductase [Desulfobacteraceae bacterium]|nr:aldo/keto reductase [Desulfobacteraceae bacterium]MDH3575293.1 aldo/keto reductase [Desulfobacteraceae bacterium]MDH3875236.1 aldo/keto reductase [Desulfobacteraceae bacterium]MDH3957335.1 aldo/keto reductase [Desulfobacteraceae bacterium]PLX54036.1 MAG: aldo/keto reductase [Desulfobacteraceae bacterium]